MHSDSTLFSELKYNKLKKMFFLHVLEYNIIKKVYTLQIELPLKEKTDPIVLLTEAYSALNAFEEQHNNNNISKHTRVHLELKLDYHFKILFCENYSIPNYFEDTTDLTKNSTGKHNV